MGTGASAQRPEFNVPEVPAEADIEAPTPAEPSPPGMPHLHERPSALFAPLAHECPARVVRSVQRMPPARARAHTHEIVAAALARAALGRDVGARAIGVPHIQQAFNALAPPHWELVPFVATPEAVRAALVRAGPVAFEIADQGKEAVAACCNGFTRHGNDHVYSVVCPLRSVGADGAFSVQDAYFRQVSAGPTPLVAYVAARVAPRFDTGAPA